MWARARRRAAGVCVAGFVAVSARGQTPAAPGAQNCTTQAKMTAAQRADLGAAAFALASAVQAGDAARVRANTVAQFAGDFNATTYLIRTTADRLTGDTLTVTQAYLLDASQPRAADISEVDFACPLSGTVSETDFAIPGLPVGRFAFVMVEARGPRPYLLSFLLQADGNAWKMAGFYPHERVVAGHDGLWYWTTARADAKADKPWLAWVLFGEADQLLRPAPFVSSGNLEKLRSEQRAAAPEPLSNGLSAQAPLSLIGPNGTQYRVTSLAAQSADQGKTLDLVMHYDAGTPLSGDEGTQRTLAAATALFSVHPELRQGFENIWVMADVPGAAPFVLQKPVSAIVAVAR